MTFDALVADIETTAAAAGPGRWLLGIAGAPASGKSTLAENLAEAVRGARMLPMDGFHLDDAVLRAHGDLPRKGAPHTFDPAGFCALLKRARHEERVYAPAFDRRLELSRAAAIEITPEDSILIVEGNYLLHDRDGWENVAPLLDACWFLDVEETALEARLTDRWTGLGLPDAEVRRKVHENDLLNARIVAEGKARADRVLGLSDLGVVG
ncbi:nucleoside/nucleotide kinase family protein [Oceanibium sediminis]|uniref:nucleoside/nucleotide kinase family protein n=1 Tax=Oceanibium sediminis TaxID=2026339 RepID=UPI000DD2CCB4|nr:nucleoside/nucleotide kinase family protein [Oceanibium sediminis]